MRRFIRTYTVKRHVQFSVIQDGDAQRYEIRRWAAEDLATEEIAAFPYAADRGLDIEAARATAICEAQRLAEAERLGRIALIKPLWEGTP